MVNGDVQSIMKSESLDSNSTKATPVVPTGKDEFREGNSGPYSDASAASSANETTLQYGDGLNGNTSANNSTGTKPNQDIIPTDGKGGDNVMERSIEALEEASADETEMEKKDRNLQWSTEDKIPIIRYHEKEEAKRDVHSSLLAEGLPSNTDHGKTNFPKLSLEMTANKNDEPIIDDNEESADANMNNTSEEYPRNTDNLQPFQIPPQNMTNSNNHVAKDDNAEGSKALQLSQETESKMDDDNDSRDSPHTAIKVPHAAQRLQDETLTNDTGTQRNGTIRTAQPATNPLAEEASGKGNGAFQSVGVGIEKVGKSPVETYNERKADALQNEGETTDLASQGRNDSTVGVSGREKENSVVLEDNPPMVTNRCDRIINPLRSMVELEEAGNRLSRKRKLLCLFRSYDTTKMDELASVAKVQRVSQLVNQRKEATVATTRPKLPSDLPAAVGLFPHPALAHAAVRPPDKSLKDLEKETLSFHIPPNTGIQERNNPSIHTFSIRFQECSISAIARWSTIRASGSRSLPEDICRRACVDTNFRKCGVCSNWGHYEKHCAHIQPLEAYRTLPASRRVPKKPQRRWPPPPSAAENKVIVEDCDGFIIEQRAFPRSDLLKAGDRRQKANDVVESTIGGIRITASTSYTGPAAPVKEGDVVAWKMNKHRMLAGSVESVDVGQGLVTARCIRSISLDAANLEGGTGEDCLGVVFSLPSTRLRSAKRPSIPSQTNKLLTTGKKKRSKFLNEDGTLRSRTTPKLLNDGTFKQPRGRKPGGKEWDHVRGVWAPVGTSRSGP